MTIRKSIASMLQAVFALASTAVTAGGSGDNTEITGQTINIGTLSRRPSSVDFQIPVVSTLGATQTCIVIGRVQTSIDGTTWVNVAANATLLTLTGGSGGTTERGVARVGCDLIRKDANFVRVMVTPDLNRANTDVATVGAGVAVFGGLDQEP